MFELPEGLIELSGMPDDDDLGLVRPPQEIIDAVNTALATNDVSDELVEWVKTQRVLQQQAAEELVRLTDGGELDDPTSRGLPGWITEEWSMVLRFPWSHRLGWAVESAKSWM